MRLLKLKIGVPPQGFSYKRMLIDVLRAPTTRRGAMSTAQVIESVRLIGLIEKVKKGGDLLLEENDYKALKARIEACQVWPAATNEIAELIEDTRSAPETKVEVKNEKKNKDG